MTPVKNTNFNFSWLGIPEYANWLISTNDSGSAGCKYCKSTFTLSNMGKRALDSHMKGKRHKELVVQNSPVNRNTLLASWVGLASKPASSASTCQQPSLSISEPSSSVSQQSVALTISSESSKTMQSYINDKESVSKAEIIWTLNVITQHESFRSSSNSSSLFQAMFPDSDIAKQFTCAKTKVMYLCVFGLAPYYEQKILNILDSVPYYSISFDESFNKQTKNEQMDFSIRYWDNETQKVHDQYLTSKFIGHATAKDLLKCFRDATIKLKPQKIVQISMDGPNVNKKLYKDLLLEREASDIDLPCLIDLGTCGLHVVHGALRKGFEETGWKLDRLLRSLWYLFNESPARRQDYAEITGSTVFPLQFCGARWIENCSVAERASLIWDDIKKYVRTTENGPKKNIPKCASFKTVSVAVNEPLTCARLQLFITTANVVEPFLKMFQTGKPMAPFLAEEIHKIMKEIMEKFVKEELLTDSISLLIDVDVEEAKNHVETKKVKIGYAAKTCLSKADVGTTKETEFRYQALNCYKAIISKLKERSPIKYKFVLYLRSLKPQYIIRHPNASVTNFGKLLDSLIELKFLSAAECDTLLKQYKGFLSLTRLEHREKFTDFGMKSEERLDVLFHSIIGNNTKFNELWKLCKMMFTLSHGQAAIERGFSINKEVLETNMSEKTIVAERIICDSVSKELSIEGSDDVSKLKIDKEMLKYCSKASSAYKLYLSEKRQNEKGSVVEAKKMKIREDIESEKKTKSNLDKAFDRHVKNADELALRAENENKFSLIAESNISRKRSLEISKEIEECHTKIMRMKEELKKL